MRIQRFRSRVGRRLLVLALSVPLLGVSGDDIFLLTTTTSPNVILLMDNSLSMNAIEWHPAFDYNASSYGCADFNNAQDYHFNSNTSQTNSGETRTPHAHATGPPG